MQKVKSCGVMVFRKKKSGLSFLLMHHAIRYDVPKGHIKKGETDLDCALRELEEETGIAPSAIRLDPVFRFETRYQTRHRKFGCQVVQKKLVMFLGELTEKVKIVPTEHLDHQWVRWDPPHQIQPETIDPLLAAVADHLSRSSRCQ